MQPDDPFHDGEPDAAALEFGFMVQPLENPEQLGEWTKSTLQAFRELGDILHAGHVGQIEGLGLQRHVAIASQADKELCVGFQRSLSVEQIRSSMKTILAEYVC